METNTAETAMHIHGWYILNYTLPRINELRHQIKEKERK